MRRDPAPLGIRDLMDPSLAQPGCAGIANRGGSLAKIPDSCCRGGWGKPGSSGCQRRTGVSPVCCVQVLRMLGAEVVVYTSSRHGASCVGTGQEDRTWVTAEARFARMIRFLSRAWQGGGRSSAGRARWHEDEAGVGPVSLRRCE
ncbi:hypothetical protein LX36DRAFT_379917 [Colletotrichum falcatum]|nr:hypothetical protein LX36DRAFT_379917 [Colletotrichum falcatum]